MTNEDWEKLRLSAIGAYTLADSLKCDPQRALFRVDPDEPRSLLIAVLVEFGDLADADAFANRFQEAAFLSHPNIATIRAAGVLEQDSKILGYFVTDSFSHTLADENLADLNETETLCKVAPPLIDALQYLHEENFVYCALSAHSVWWVDQRWKLADFSELRVSGTHSAVATRRMLIRSDLSTPPEAYQGIVSPAWDAWSLGSLLHESVAQKQGPSNGDPRTGSSPLVSAECNYIINELLDPDSSKRLSLKELKERLAALHVESVPSVTQHQKNHESKLTASSDRFVEEPLASLPPYPALPFQQRPAPYTYTPPAKFRPFGLQPATLTGGFLGLATVILGALVFERHNSHENASVPSQARTADRASVESIRNTPETQRITPETKNQNSTQEAVLAVLRQWVVSTRSKNINEQIACYAPFVDHYFGRKNVTRNDVRADKERLFARIGTVRDFSLSHVQMKIVNPTSVIVVADKNWNFPDRHFAGVAHEELTLRQIGTEWKIASERESRRRSAYAGNSRRLAPPYSEFPSPVVSDPQSMIAGTRP